MSFTSILQIKLEQIIAILVTLASAGLAWYSSVNSKLNTMETELRLKDKQLEYFDERFGESQISIQKIVDKQEKMSEDINAIKVIIERKADRQ